MTDGICSFATWRPTKNFGYPQGTHGQLSEADCITDHIMAGWKSTLDDPNWREPNGVGVHFGIGRDGSISQYINLFDASHGHGVSGSKTKYDRGNRHLAAWERRPGAQWIQVPYAGTTAYALIEPNGRGGTQSIPNCRAVAKEHEGFPFDRPGFDATWPLPMLEASRRVDEWIMEEFWRVKRWEMQLDQDMKIGHFQIDAVNRSNCPGPEWPKQAILGGLRRVGEEDFMANEKEIAETFWGLQDNEIVKAKDDPAVYIVSRTGDIPILLRVDNSRTDLLAGKQIKTVPLGVIAYGWHGGQAT